MDSPDFSGKCALIVEDNPLNMKLFTAMLCALGLSVLQAEDGRRGLELAREEDPDLIVLDVKLPGMSGLDVARRLKQDPLTDDIPIIVTTANGMSAADEAIRGCGCEGFMAKPIGVADFIALTESVLLRSARQPRYVRRLIEVNEEV